MAGILPAQSERELRQLRFKDPQTEQAFRHGYARQARCLAGSAARGHILPEPISASGFSTCFDLITALGSC